jgi:hypothetical protein
VRVTWGLQHTLLNQPTRDAIKGWQHREMNAMAAYALVLTQAGGLGRQISHIRRRFYKYVWVSGIGYCVNIFYPTHPRSPEDVINVHELLDKGWWFEQFCCGVCGRTSAKSRKDERRTPDTFQSVLKHLGVCWRCADPGPRRRLACANEGWHPIAISWPLKRALATRLNAAAPTSSPSPFELCCTKRHLFSAPTQCP